MKYITVFGGANAIALANYIMMLPNDVRCVLKHRNAAAFGDFIICCHKSTYAINLYRDYKTSVWRNVNFCLILRFSKNLVTENSGPRFINMQNYKNFQNVKTRKESENCPRHVQL